MYQRPMDESALRRHLRAMLDTEQAHVSILTAVESLPEELTGVVPEGWAYSAWQLLEHVRISEQDILDYCTADEYVERAWPKEYWPEEVAPADASSWNRSVDAYRNVRSRVVAILDDETVSLFDHVPHSETHTYLRELLLIADHTAYHAGQIVALSRVLGAWPR